jgi:hypothetical protein
MHLNYSPGPSLLHTCMHLGGLLGRDLVTGLCRRPRLWKGCHPDALKAFLLEQVGQGCRVLGAIQSKVSFLDQCAVLPCM